ncbi:hypothetical protein CEY00_Acc11978 [Actinidia chinensis var. chinensis]|uniref:Uncharacterized protein n=1 Tax=Actinidia chinensis var. chinensis TaxID=1590841 RepID=A0A2R6QXV6_ACTCC|nr:hypothetical protein CEY00_Acc11978 [Actinidia chinensis var. chinensis]
MMNFVLVVLVVVVVVVVIDGCSGQQAYVNNKQLDCYKNYSNTGGYLCNNGADVSSCLSYLTFRSTPIYNSAATIGYLLSADPSQIAQINNISDVDTLPSDTLLIVPTNCSCNNNNTYYQHNASYVLKTTSETYFTVSNNTYQGLTTCQSMMAQNPYNYRDLLVGMKLTAPLRCACPTSNQTHAGFTYLLTYLVTWRDTISLIAHRFRSDESSILDANQLSSDDIVFPFTPILVPLKTKPTKIDSAVSPPPPPTPPTLATVPVGNQSTSSSKGVFIGVGVGGVVLLLFALAGFLFWFFRRRPNRHGQPVPDTSPPTTPPKGAVSYTTALPDSKSWSVSPEGVRYAVGSLTVYKYEELEKGTAFFREDNRIKGSVYMGSFKGDKAAVKVMKGNVSEEINILKQINHSNIIRLSGLCVHDGNTYLVYEYADNGSLADWLLRSKKKGQSQSLGWKQRVQIAYDVADALNYLHNYATPPYIHKNLKSSNILLDGELRAKLANFGLARSIREDQDLQLTRHVVGTYGYMAPEYIDNGLVTPKLDVYAFGVVILELLSGSETGNAIQKKRNGQDEEEEELLSASISQVLGGENVREKLRGFMDPSLSNEYPLDLAYSLAQLANKCVAHPINSRPPISEVFVILSKILSSSMDWDSSSYEVDPFT